MLQKNILIIYIFTEDCYDTTQFLTDCNAKVGRDNIFQPTIGTESVHPESNDNEIILVNFATTKNLMVFVFDGVVNAAQCIATF